MKQNFFSTLSAALEAVRDYLEAANCVLLDESDLFNKFTFGGVAYGQTVQSSALLSVYKGKAVAGRMAKRACSVSVYRMESGTYECVAYVS